MAAAAPAEPTPPAADRLAALDAVRVLATIAIFTFHYMGEAGAVFLSMEALGQFAKDHPWYVPALFFLADVGVQAFIYLSFFSLTWSALRKPGLAFGRWLLARAQRIYPGLWLCMLALMAFDLLTLGTAFRMAAADYAANALGITIVRRFQQMAGAWWFVGMILTAYPLFPLLLWCARRRLGWFLVAAGWLLSKASELWLAPQVGGWFHTFHVSFVGIRLMEIALGVALAAALFQAGPGALGRATGWRPVGVLAIGLLATFLSFGMTPHFAPIGPLRGCLLLCLLALLCARLPAAVLGLCGRLAGPTYLVYLLHQPVIGRVAAWVKSAGLDGVAGLAATWAALLVALFVAAVPLDALALRIGRLVFRGR